MRLGDRGCSHSDAWQFVSAYAMCVLGGTESPGVADVKKVSHTTREFSHEQGCVVGPRIGWLRVAGRRQQEGRGIR